ncbi:hypothetical protein AB0758_43940 [Tolypothrix bouteillei VB521301_2]|uniref:Uncharacterized protein n=1 Tax=Tolypothrix bouteillei VB521301 TaxID=1479485 RepID=A0A0C1QVU8_9CYAN
MGKPRRPRMMFSCSEEVKVLLEKWAEEEGRSTSNVIERIINEAIASKYSVEITSKPYQRRSSQQRQPITIASLVKDNYQKLIDMGCIKPERLEALALGEKPNASDLTKLAHNLDLDEEYIIELRDRSFPKKSQTLKKQTNGTT